MSFKQEINKQEKEILDHLMESKFIASFTEVDSETGEYIRDIKEADDLEIDFEVRDSMLSAIGECAERPHTGKYHMDKQKAGIVLYAHKRQAVYGNRHPVPRRMVLVFNTLRRWKQ